MVNVLQLAEISSNVYEDTTVGIGAWTRHNKMPPMKATSGFFGAFYVEPSRQIGVLAFRGSEFGDFMNDWVKTDGMIGLGRIPMNQVSDSFGYAARVKRFAASIGCQKLYVTGHSLGGGLASLVGANLAGFIGATYNAPGMGALSGPVNFTHPHASSIYNFRAADDPVSRVGTTIGHRPISLSVTSFAVSLIASINPLAGLAHKGYSHMIGPLIDALAKSTVGKKLPEQCG